MNIKLLFLVFLAMTLCHFAFSQAIIGNPKTNSLIVKKIGGSDLLIPIEIGFLNSGTVASTPTISVNLNNTHTSLINQFNLADLAKIRIINNQQTLDINPGITLNAPKVIYLFIDRTVNINFDKIIYLKVVEATNVISTIKVTIQPEDQIYTLPQYLSEANILSNVTKVESAGNILTVNGYRTITDNGQTDSLFFKKNIALEIGQVLAINEWSFVWNLKHWQPVPFSITTIPFKVRPEITFDNRVFTSTASSGISNLGFNLDLAKYQMDRYFATGKKSSHKLSLGFWAAPSVEELDSIYTNGYLAKDVKSKQLFISTGLTISYSYNDISFVFVPVGWDFATSTIGKNWVYNGERWWGFGIAISPKVFRQL